jgi:hypothetical protein
MRAERQHVMMFSAKAVRVMRASARMRGGGRGKGARGRREARRRPTRRRQITVSPLYSASAHPCAPILHHPLVHSILRAILLARAAARRAWGATAPRLRCAPLASGPGPRKDGVTRAPGRPPRAPPPAAMDAINTVIMDLLWQRAPPMESRFSVAMADTVLYRRRCVPPPPAAARRRRIPPHVPAARPALTRAPAVRPFPPLRARAPAVRPTAGTSRRSRAR